MAGSPRNEKIILILAYSVGAFLILGLVIVVVLVSIDRIDSAGNILRAQFDMVTAIISGIIGYVAGSSRGNGNGNGNSKDSSDDDEGGSV